MVTDSPTCFSMTPALFMPCFYPFLCKNINMQYIILKLRPSTINSLILFLPEFNEVLMTIQNVRIYGPVNIMLI